VGVLSSASKDESTPSLAQLGPESTHPHRKIMIRMHTSPECYLNLESLSEASRAATESNIHIWAHPFDVTLDSKPTLRNQNHW
jgi:hypothetical protein